MSEWMDVPVAEVAVGDEVKVDGIGENVATGGALESYASAWWLVRELPGEHVTLLADIAAGFRRSSIVAVRRRKPEPQPKPGDWRHGAPCSLEGKIMRYIDLGEREACTAPQVYRASSGWSRDTRDGHPWVMKTGDPVEILIRGEAGNLMPAFFYSAKKSVLSGPQLSDPPYEDFYKRIGLDVRPVERRAKR